MAASYSAAAQAFMQCSTTSNYHTKSDADIEILVRELAKLAKDSDDANEIVLQCLRQTQFCPTVADLHSAASAVHTANTPEWSPATSTCACGGTGWLHSERIIRGVRYDFSAPCACRVPEAAA